jgi:hypothetical protein
MPSQYQPLPPLPPPQIPVIDTNTGRLTLVWAQWFAAVDTIVREAQSKEP